MWQANACHLPSNCLKLANALSKGIDGELFKKSWDEIQTPGFELFQTTKDGKWIYSKRLLEQVKEIETIQKKRAEAGRRGGQAKGVANDQANDKQMLSKCYDEDPPFA